jgi:Tfp pilus assembly protein PilE
MLGQDNFMGSKNITNSKGFTVVELLITIGICGVIVPSIALGLAQLALLNNRSRDLALINLIAQNKVELLRSTGYNSLGSGTTSFSSELPNVISAPKIASYTITDVATGIKEVTISITYQDVKNPRTINYKTLISEIGVGQ